ncbi:bifunctional diaminohydroxyphosphoribosylaminopyrimidine deaminase/5-amino-6-(5-phosphoribosylamino)uracil reductase RibD [Campylobacter sp. CCUG 57310]|uniref:bifunctional diaminohydroxyphosphoribosylaminopyrimidine deaminase/5-amino-6-(5-phosphoribosylamino)uracil reductase RibD n=1 Tax=Campylobacter sp. CCUG 57310 TaxID=2517362 RepID=UPI001565A869|nr:bifunctional diaminohydroxyphosphoribosylaminopyrimidine deaminase/5-amino-6-(5-phosphoribosylamino)uracil reductase RibD [Campylobacter sp. CCUG 57310]QKF92781.1 diaminohydroxyphosphoribosylaminopyrimidine deaminase / 5-amino-6-(5-phosphoribosylamino)uracil reductase [Campylobacter sp. CCUG 57310]
MINDEFYMSLAIKKAWKFQLLTYPNPAVGCVILDKNGRILAIKAHKKAGFLHAEPLAVFFALCTINKDFLAKFLREYNREFNLNFSDILDLENADLEPKFTYEFILKNHDNLLEHAKAYVTLEPCSHEGKTPSCANLLKELRFSEVIIARIDENKIASGGAEILKASGIKVKFGVLKEAADELIEPFLAWQSGNFSFFKLALSANGVTSGGIISNELSRTHSHKLRSVCGMLVIGGNTVRIDRPTLDTRLISNGKNPDILIYSRDKNFDKSIPLFNVKNRNVEISDSLENAFEKPLVMFEGGENFLKNLDERVKWILIYQSSEFKNAPNARLNLKLKRLFSSNFASDSYAWLKRI